MGKEEVERRITARARNQHGVITFKQLLDCGLKRGSVSRRINGGTFHEIYPGVYAAPGIPIGWMQRISAAVLWGGDDAAAAGFAAGELLGLDGARKKELEIVVPYSQNPKTEGVLVHRSRKLGKQDLLTYRWPRRTNIGRTLVDLADRLSDRDLERALDSAWKAYRSALVWVREAVARCGRRGRSAKVGRLLELTALRLSEPADSVLETDVWPILREGGVPQPQIHYVVQGCPWYDPEVDLAWPRQKVLLQVDGYTIHGRYRNWVNDRRIRRYLSDRGWQVVEVTREDVEQRASEIVRSVRIRLARTYAPAPKPICEAPVQAA